MNGNIAYGDYHLLPFKINSINLSFISSGFFRITYCGKVFFLFRWTNDQNANTKEESYLFLINNSIQSKNKEIMLACGLTSVQNKQEIKVNRTCKTTKT